MLTAELSETLHLWWKELAAVKVGCGIANVAMLRECANAMQPFDLVKAAHITVHTPSH